MFLIENFVQALIRRYHQFNDQSEGVELVLIKFLISVFMYRGILNWLSISLTKFKNMKKKMPFNSLYNFADNLNKLRENILFLIENCSLISEYFEKPSLFRIWNFHKLNQMKNLIDM